jgi:hypothetical protein
MCLQTEEAICLLKGCRSILRFWRRRSTTDLSVGNYSVGGWPDINLSPSIQR